MTTATTLRIHPKGIHRRTTSSSSNSSSSSISREHERDDPRLPRVHVHRPGGLGLRVPRGKDAHVRLGEHDGHHPGAYVAWKIILILLFTLLLAWVVKEINTFISYNKSKAKPIVTMQFFKLLLLLVATILRWVWLLDPHRTSKVWPAPLFGEDEATWNVVTTPLIIAPQIIFIIIIVLEIQQWRLVVNSSDRLRSIRNNVASKWRVPPQTVMVCIIFPLCFIFVFVMACSFAAGRGGRGSLRGHVDDL